MGNDIVNSDGRCTGWFYSRLASTWNKAERSGSLNTNHCMAVEVKEQPVLGRYDTIDELLMVYTFCDWHGLAILTTQSGIVMYHKRILRLEKPGISEQQSNKSFSGF
jgi:hypothetical protein